MTRQQRANQLDKKGVHAARRRPLVEMAPTPAPKLSPSIETILHMQRSIGNRATTQYLQRQGPEGSVTVAGSASKEEGAADKSSYTGELAKERGEDKSPSDKELDETLKKKASKAHGTPKFHSQHPSLAQLGIRPKEIKGEKHGVYVGNEDYKDEAWADLPGAKADANRMKNAMQGHGYKTIKHAKDQNGAGVESTFSSAMSKAKSGDAVLLYYAGHGVPGGIVGVNSKVEAPESVKEAGSGEKGSDRGFTLVKAGEAKKSKGGFTYKGYKISDVKKYASLLKPLEAGIAKGVHSTLIADACHSGSATDLVREKAVEKLASDKSAGMNAVKTQIKRLEDMKKQTPKDEAKGGEEDRGFKKGNKPIELEASAKSSAEQYWADIVKPELEVIATYLKEAGIKITVPAKPSDYSKAGIEQQINLFINQLVDLGEKIKEERKKSTLSIAP